MIYFNEVIFKNNKEQHSDISFNIENSGKSKFSEIGRFPNNNRSASLLMKTDLHYLETSTAPIIFTSVFNLKTFQIIKNLFVSLFKITYPEDFFIDVYNKKLHSIIGLIKETKEVICFAHIDIDKTNKKAKILTLAVVKEYQNKKIGTRLMNKILEELTMIGITDVSLIVQEVNDAAIKMYKKFEFTIEKVMDDYYSIGNKKDNRALQMTRKMLIKKVWIVEILKKISGCFFK